MGPNDAEGRSLDLKFRARPLSLRRRDLRGQGMDLSDLHKILQQLAAPRTLDPLTFQRLAEAVREQSLTKGAHLFRAGDAAEALYFVRSGLTRYYYLADGIEHTGQFFLAGDFVADVAALTTGTPCVQSMDALRPTEVLVIPRTALLAAYEADPAMERFGRRMMEADMVGSKRRTASLLQLNPAERYDRLVAMRPQVIAQAPQYIVASYLGVTPESLSRIRRRRTQVR